MRGFESQFTGSLINAPRLPLQRQRLPNPYHRYIRAMLPARRQTRPHRKPITQSKSGLAALTNYSRFRVIAGLKKLVSPPALEDSRRSCRSLTAR